MKTMPWDDIQVPSCDYNTRLVKGTGTIPVYWGRDPEGHCLLIVELVGDHTRQFRKAALSIHGLRVDLRQSNTAVQNQNLVLTLDKHVDRDLFFGLCETMIAGLVSVTDPAVGLSVVLTHIKRWKAFLAGRKTRLLSPEEIRGLFGELHFLRLLYQKHLDERSAITAWCGPEGMQQDFIFEDTAVEVKTLSGKERNRVRITSEDQLEALSGDLFLVIFRLSELPDSIYSLSLNEAVCRIDSELTDAEAIEAFSGRLAEFGYIPVQEYDQPKLQVTGVYPFKVSDNFPRLIRNRIPEGVVRVSYEIELEHIESFGIEEESIFRR